MNAIEWTCNHALNMEPRPLWPISASNPNSGEITDWHRLEVQRLLAENRLSRPHIAERVGVSLKLVDRIARSLGD